MTYEGLYTGALTTWQFVLLIVTAALLTMTTSPSELISGIERLLRPLKWIGVPSHDVAMMISLALRFVPTLLGEIHRIRDAQAARGARLNHGPILNRLKAVSALVLPVVLSAFRRADALAMAMAARGYGGGKRTTMRELSLGRGDYVAMMVMAMLTAGYVFVML
ncbi:MAG: energy-coupling factor transporter transmembrane component T [Deltaproteobacteria bacterium]|nr:energy-coupling factor transporter transmembrane component T [Deltaproteobacteria bacterium]